MFAAGPVLWGGIGLIERAQNLDQAFHEAPDGRLQPFVIKDTHIQRLMPVFDGYKANTLPRVDTILTQGAYAYTGGHQIQRGLGGVDGAYDPLLCVETAGPLAEAVFHIVIEYYLRLSR